MFLRFLLAIVLVAFTFLSPNIGWGAGPVLWEDDTLYVGYYENYSYNRTNGLVCGVKAEEMVSIHLVNKAPLNPDPSFKYMPMATYDALVGIVVQIRGSENLCRNLVFDLNLKMGDSLKKYRGIWEAPQETCSPNVVATTTDWWIILDEYFTSDQIREICANNSKFLIEIVSYKFRG